MNAVDYMRSIRAIKRELTKPINQTFKSGPVQRIKSVLDLIKTIEATEGK